MSVGGGCQDVLLGRSGRPRDRISEPISGCGVQIHQADIRPVLGREAASYKNHDDHDNEEDYSRPCKDCLLLG